MAASGRTPKWLTFSITLAVATVSAASAAISVYLWRGKSGFDAKQKIRELEMSLKSSQEKCAAERQGRIKTQQALRTALQTKSENLEFPSFPMAPIAVVRSCFSTRNGTPRQPLLVPLARAFLEFDPARVPPASLEGLAEYSHCWIIYVFHLNTDLEKLWKHPLKSKFKAKVRVPRLKGGRMGVFATRSPHRPCPIGLTVAKVEAVQENMVLLSGVDLVDGTPILDIKPYLPYCDSIQGATVPLWVKADNSLTVASVNFSEGFFASLAGCWSKLEKKSLYASSDEFQCLVKQVLSWDIRSISQRTRPHNVQVDTENGRNVENIAVNLDVYLDQAASSERDASRKDRVPLPAGDIIYHLILEGLDVSYRIDSGGNVLVEEVSFSSHVPENYENSENSSLES